MWRLRAFYTPEHTIRIDVQDYLRLKIIHCRVLGLHSDFTTSHRRWDSSWWKHWVSMPVEIFYNVTDPRDARQPQNHYCYYGDNITISIQTHMRIQHKVAFYIFSIDNSDCNFLLFWSFHRYLLCRSFVLRSHQEFFFFLCSRRCPWRQR